LIIVKKCIWSTEGGKAARSVSTEGERKEVSVGFLVREELVTHGDDQGAKAEKRKRRDNKKRVCLDAEGLKEREREEVEFES